MDQRSGRKRGLEGQDILPDRAVRQDDEEDRRPLDWASAVSDEDIAKELLLRDTYEVILNVDLTTAKTMDDASLARVLGEAAVQSIREFLAEDDDS
jgi:hypothetical protein